MPTAPDDTPAIADDADTLVRRSSPLAASVAGAVVGTPLGYFARIWLGILGGGRLPIGAGYGLLYGLSVRFVVGLIRRQFGNRSPAGSKTRPSLIIDS